MPDPITPVTAVKQAVSDTVSALKLVDFSFGRVISTSPLQIYVDQKTTYPASMLILTRNVTDYQVDVEISAYTEVVSHGHPVTDTYTGGGTAEPVDHRHPISGTKTLTIKNALVVNDYVLLARVPGGKRHIVLDRISPNPNIGGEWNDSAGTG